jgi:predicted dehydrogenase
MKREKIKIAMIGCGRFAGNFVPLFKAHPEVERVFVCDLIRERAEAYSAQFDVPIVDSFEDALSSPEINAVAIFTQRFLHGPMVIAALRAGKHVYSAVPCAISIDEIREIEALVRSTRLTYSMGETGFYRAATIFCRKMYKEGRFGEFVYGESQYNHDIRNMELSYRSSGGERWKEYAGIPPMFYPTHSTAMLLSTMPGVRATAVSAQGYVSRQTDIYGTDGQNLYENPFANTAMLLKLSNGGVARVSENRNVGWQSPETYISQYYGTDGCYEFSVAHHYVSQWDSDSERKGRVVMRDVSAELLPESVMKGLREDYPRGLQAIADGAGFFETAPIQNTAKLPASFKNLRNGHNGTHQYLVDDFCRAYASGKLSPTNIWEVARWNIPGLVAHRSALAGGELLPVPDLGDPPSDWEGLEPIT